MLLLCGSYFASEARAGNWDSIIANTHWYVPVPQLLAYASPRTGFTDPIPIGDQTLWSLDDSTDGVFTGTSTAQLAIGPIVSASDTTIEGVVTPDGQIRMVFTPASGGTTTVGLGRMQSIGGVTTMEMQMITGADLLVTHWAYMVPYDPAAFTPPAPWPAPANSAPQWAWAAGVPWKIVSPTLFGTDKPGHFIITNYKNGYFWGRGAGPAADPSGDYTLLGSITPEGKVLFNTLSESDLTSLYGDIEGDASTAQMVLREYDSQGLSIGPSTYVYVIRPYAETVTEMDNPAALGAAEVLYEVAGTPVGFDGAMAPAIDFLNNSSGAALSDAISQTLPVLAGNAAAATYNAQRGLQQLVGARVDALQGTDMQGEIDPEQRIWLKPLGGIVRQSSQDGIPGYRINSGGVAAGTDTAVSRDFRLGGMLAYSYSSITGSDDAVPNTLRVDSYQAGTYGTYLLTPGVNVDFQLDAALNRSSETRSITFMDSTASADYDGYTIHAMAGIKKRFSVGSRAVLSPLLHLDYGRYSADSYRETGAGALNLDVDSQAYRELRISAGVEGAYQIADRVRFTAHAGVSNNLLNEQPEAEASYEGGGARFVTPGLDGSPWLYSAGVGLSGVSNDRLGVTFRYDIQASPTGFLDQMASLVFVLRI